MTAKANMHHDTRHNDPEDICNKAQEVARTTLIPSTSISLLRKYHLSELKIHKVGANGFM